MESVNLTNGFNTMMRKIDVELYRVTYWLLCRLYARRLGDKPADVVMRFLSSLFPRITHRYWANLSNPLSLSEQLWHRMLFDRNPRSTAISDKLEVLRYVKEKVGRDYLIPLLWIGDNPDQTHFDELRSRFVTKATHGCKDNTIVREKTVLTIGYQIPI